MTRWLLCVPLWRRFGSLTAVPVLPTLAFRSSMLLELPPVACNKCFPGLSPQLASPSILPLSQSLAPQAVFLGRLGSVAHLCPSPSSSSSCSCPPLASCPSRPLALAHGVVRFGADCRRAFFFSVLNQRTCLFLAHPHRAGFDVRLQVMMWPIIVVRRDRQSSDPAAPPR